MPTCESLPLQTKRNSASLTMRALRFFRFGTGSTKPTGERFGLTARGNFRRYRRKPNSWRICALSSQISRSVPILPTPRSIWFWTAAADSPSFTALQTFTSNHMEDRAAWIRRIGRRRDRFAANNERFRPNWDQLSPPCCNALKRFMTSGKSCSPRITGEGNTVAEAVAFDLRVSEKPAISMRLTGHPFRQFPNCAQPEVSRTAKQKQWKIR
jgi:hypothetical protein